ncbi:MAG: energy-coupling factor transporter transmembrane protein EcfT [Candidatus Tyloplasma litorale]|nr:MAG: energy-coupling factor transporter transmembrane protein EcfT [Mycoplasmatales bacterium]
MEKSGYSRYRQINSIIHKIDPITKLLCFILITSALFISQSEKTLLIVFAFVFLISILSKIKIKSYLVTFLFIFPFFILMFLLYLIIMSPLDSLTAVSSMSIRLYILLLISIIYTSTTKEVDITDSIEWFISPLKYIKVPTYEISMMITLAIRFIPLMIEDIKIIFIAQTSRGINVVNGNLLTRIKGIFNSLLPMFVISFRRADDISKAMIIRGYKIGQKRSKYRKNKFFILEFISLLICLFLVIIVSLMINGVI